MIAAVAQDMNHPDESPALKLPETITDVSAGDREQGSDLVRRKRLGGQVQERVDLGDCAVQAPSGTEFAPVEYKFLLAGCQACHTAISV
jgi:hypothetical protein